MTYILDNSKEKEEFVNRIKDLRIPLEILPKNKMDSIFGNSHQGYGAYRANYSVYDDSIINQIEGENKRIVILDGIMDPHNLGAIIRSVDAFGFDAIVLPKNRSCPITETVAHISTGAIEYVKIAYVNSLSTFVERLKKNGVVVGLQHFQIVFCNAHALQLLNGICKQFRKHLLAAVFGNDTGAGIKYHALVFVDAIGIENKSHHLLIAERAVRQ